MDLPVDRPVVATPSLPPRARPRWVTGLALGAAATLLASAAFVVPSLLGATLNGNEARVISRMKKICNAQSQMQASVRCDPDGNGQGRYGFFADLIAMASAPNVRDPDGLVFESPILPRDHRRVVDGRVRAHGYVYELFLPAIGGGWVSDRDPAAASKINGKLAEMLWTCYAWPESPGWSGKRVFMINQNGDVLSSQNADGRCGGDRSPQPGLSGFVSPQVGSAVAAMCADCLGETWFVMG